jgi:hypothetical protein
MPAGQEHGGRERSARLQVARTGISTRRAQRVPASPAPRATFRRRERRCPMAALASSGGSRV